MHNLQLEIAKEVERVYHETKDYRQAFKEVTEMYKKAYSLTDQDKENKHDIENFKDIIPLGTDLDNDDLFMQKGDMYV